MIGNKTFVCHQRSCLRVCPHTRGRADARCRATPAGKDRGVVDHVYVQDWGGDDFDAGDLKARGPVRRVLDYSAKNGLSFPQTVTNFLAEAEQMNRFTRSHEAQRREIPPFEKWLFKEEHYEQYLVDLEHVHASMAWAVEQAQGGVRRIDGNNAEKWIIIDPVKLGIYRGDCIHKDIEQLRATRPAGVSLEENKVAQQNAMEYANTIFSALGTACTTCSDPDEMRILVSKLCAHVYLVTVSQIAIGNRIGSVCVEKIDLVQRDAAHTYLDYSCEHPPQKTIRVALDAFGQALSEPMKEAFFDELVVATEHCSLLIDSLARDT